MLADLGMLLSLVLSELPAALWWVCAPSSSLIKRDLLTVGRAQGWRGSPCLSVLSRIGAVGHIVLGALVPVGMGLVFLVFLVKCLTWVIGAA